MSVHVPTQPVSRPSSSQARDGAQLEPAVLAVVAPQADLRRRRSADCWRPRPSARTGRPPRRDGTRGRRSGACHEPGHAPCTRPNGRWLSRTRPAASVRQAMSGIASARSRYPRSSRSGGSRTSTPGSAVLAGEGRIWHGSSQRGCHRSAGWALPVLGTGTGTAVTRGWRAPRNRPCNDMTSPDWAIRQAAAILRPQTIDIVVAEGTSYACRACRSPCTPPGRDRSALRDARPDGLRVRRDPSLGFGGHLARAAVLAAALGLRHRWRADVRQRRPARDHPGRPGLPRPGRWSRALVRGARAGPGRRLRADRTRRRRERRTARGPGFRPRRSGCRRDRDGGAGHRDPEGPRRPDPDRDLADGRPTS